MGMIPGMMGHEIPVRREVLDVNGYTNLSLVQVIKKCTAANNKVY